MRYAHTFLFVCPDCNLPIAISKINDEKNLEIDGARVRIKCNYCEHISDQLALTAKTHWVTDWADSTDSTGSLSKETKAGQPSSESNLRER